MFFVSTLFSSDIMIQLDEKFNFVGVDSYESNFGSHIKDIKSKLSLIDSYYSDSLNKDEKKKILSDRSAVEKNSIDYKLKNHIHDLLLEYYGSDVIEVRLKNMKKKERLDH